MNAGAKSVLDGVRVVDLSRGIAGPVTGMLLSDHGADVLKVEPPGGDPHRAWPAYAVWCRGRRSAGLELRDPGARERLEALCAEADIVLESFAPGAAERLGLDRDALLARNPRLIWTSIPAYPEDHPDAARPGWDALVAARTGLFVEQRSSYASPGERVAGTAPARSALELPPGSEQTGHREGPIFLAVPYPSFAAALLALNGIGAALYVRERTGRGQRVCTSLLQGVGMACTMLWQVAERPETPGFRFWYFDRRAPKGLFRCADGAWLHQWPPIEHAFVQEAARGGKLCMPEPERVLERARSLPQASSDYDETVVLQARANARTAEAFARFPRSEWLELLARAGKGAAAVRSPEEALQDELLEREGVIARVDDPERGRLRQVGVLARFERSPARVQGPLPRPAAAGQVPAWLGPPGEVRGDRRAAPQHALAGVRVLDFGLAIAGPYGPQLLADLGADVIKVGGLREDLTSHMYLGCHRGKRSIAVDLKTPRGREIAHRLIAGADVVHHNMRAGVAERLGIDYESARALNPRVIYCHSRGFEAEGPRASLPGTDQTGNALAGTEYENGATHLGQPPVFSPTGLGDLGTGAFSAACVLQALYHRERTGQGQWIDTSILNVAMLFNSYTYTDEQGRGPERLRLDAEQRGLCALYSLYETAAGWLCLAAPRESHWDALRGALPGAGLEDPRFATARERRANDALLRERLARAFRTDSAAHWLDRLDRAGVPAEIVREDYARRFLEDPAQRAAGRAVEHLHPRLGRLLQPGLLVELRDTPGRIAGPPPIAGQHTAEILSECGYDERAIAKLAADGVVAIRAARP